MPQSVNGPNVSSNYGIGSTYILDLLRATTRLTYPLTAVFVLAALPLFSPHFLPCRRREFLHSVPSQLSW